MQAIHWEARLKIQRELERLPTAFLSLLALGSREPSFIFSKGNLNSVYSLAPSLPLFLSHSVSGRQGLLNDCHLHQSASPSGVLVTAWQPLQVPSTGHAAPPSALS